MITLKVFTFLFIQSIRVVAEVSNQFNFIDLVAYFWMINTELGISG